LVFVEQRVSREICSAMADATVSTEVKAMKAHAANFHFAIPRRMWWNPGDASRRAGDATKETLDCLRKAYNASRIDPSTRRSFEETLVAPIRRIVRDMNSNVLKMPAFKHVDWSETGNDPGKDGGDLRFRKGMVLIGLIAGHASQFRHELCINRKPSDYLVISRAVDEGIDRMLEIVRDAQPAKLKEALVKDAAAKAAAAEVVKKEAEAEKAAEQAEAAARPKAAVAQPAAPAKRKEVPALTSAAKEAAAEVEAARVGYLGGILTALAMGLLKPDLYGASSAREVDLSDHLRRTLAQVKYTDSRLTPLFGESFTRGLDIASGRSIDGQPAHPSFVDRLSRISSSRSGYTHEAQLGFIVGCRIALARLVVDWQAAWPTGTIINNALKMCGVGWNVAVASTVQQLLVGNSRGRPTDVIIVKHEVKVSGEQANEAGSKSAQDKEHERCVAVSISREAAEHGYINFAGTMSQSGATTLPCTSEESSADRYWQPTQWVAAIIDLRAVYVPLSDYDVQMAQTLIDPEAVHPTDDRRGDWQRAFGFLPGDDGLPPCNDRQICESDNFCLPRLPDRIIGEVLASHSRLFGGVISYTQAILLVGRLFILDELSAENTVRRLCGHAFTPIAPEKAGNWVNSTHPNALRIGTVDLSSELPPSTTSPSPPTPYNAIVTRSTEATLSKERNPTLLFSLAFASAPVNLHPAILAKIRGVDQRAEMFPPAGPGENCLDPPDKDCIGVGAFARTDATHVQIIDDTVYGSHWNASVVLGISHCRIDSYSVAFTRDMGQKRRKGKAPEVVNSRIAMRAVWPAGWPATRARFAHAVYAQALKCIVGHDLFARHTYSEVADLLNRHGVAVLDGTMAFLLKPTLALTATPSNAPNVPHEISIMLLRLGDTIGSLLPPATSRNRDRWVVLWRNTVVFSTLSPRLTAVFAAVMHGKTGAAYRFRPWAPAEAGPGDAQSPEELLDHLHARLEWGAFDLQLDERDPGEGGHITPSWHHGIGVMCRYAQVFVLMSHDEFMKAEANVKAVAIQRAATQRQRAMQEVAVATPAMPETPERQSPGTYGTHGASSSPPRPLAGRPSAVGGAMPPQAPPAGAASPPPPDYVPWGLMLRPFLAEMDTFYSEMAALSNARKGGAPSFPAGPQGGNNVTSTLDAKLWTYDSRRHIVKTAESTHRRSAPMMGVTAEYEPGIAMTAAVHSDLGNVSLRITPGVTTEQRATIVRETQRLDELTAAVMPSVAVESQCRRVNLRGLEAYHASGALFPALPIKSVVLRKRVYTPDGNVVNHFVALADDDQARRLLCTAFEKERRGELHTVLAMTRRIDVGAGRSHD
jgi:hypothetical protein